MVPFFSPAKVVEVVVLVPAGLRADLLYFAQGGRVQVPAESGGDGTVRLDLPDGVGSGSSRRPEAIGSPESVVRHVQRGASLYGNR